MWKEHSAGYHLAQAPRNSTCRVRSLWGKAPSANHIDWPFNETVAIGFYLCPKILDLLGLLNYHVCEPCWPSGLEMSKTDPPRAPEVHYPFLGYTKESLPKQFSRILRSASEVHKHILQLESLSKHFSSISEKRVRGTQTNLILFSFFPKP